MKSKQPQHTALITGASSGIGFAIAQMLGKEGYALTLVARREQKLQKAAEELTTAGVANQYIAADLRDETQIQKTVDLHREMYGRLDVLVNNAGIGIGSGVEELNTKHVDIQLATNLRAPILFYKACAVLLRQAGSEHGKALAVNIASIVGKQAEPWLSVYSATKFGLVGFSEAMNKELGKSGVKSTVICPSFVDTPMTDFAKNKVPAETMIQPSDIAVVIQSLLTLTPACVANEIILNRPGLGGLA